MSGGMLELGGDRDEVRAALAAPFPPEAIKQRPGGKGKLLDYLEAHTVIRRLNEATGGRWEFRVLGQGQTGDLLTALVELAIPGLGARQHVGVQKFAPGSGEDLYKGAITDGLKKAATLFGVGLELYGEDYEGEAAPPPPQPPPTPIKVQDWPDEQLLRVLGQADRPEAQIRRAAEVYLGRAADRDQLLARTKHARQAGLAKDLAHEIARARADALGLPRVEPVAAPAAPPAAESPVAKRMALIWATARERGWDEARVRAFGQQLYRSDRLDTWSVDQLDSFLTWLRSGNHAAAG